MAYSSKSLLFSCLKWSTSIIQVNSFEYKAFQEKESLLGPVRGKLKDVIWIHHDQLLLEKILPGAQLDNLQWSIKNKSQLYSNIRQKIYEEY